MNFNLETIINSLFLGKLPSYDKIIQIISSSENIFSKLPNIIKINSPCIILGDIHGQFFDLINILSSQKFSPEYDFSYNGEILFLGDIVDRGHYSTETVVLILSLKLLFPNRIHIIRGNHESKSISSVYGFYDELRHRVTNGEIVPTNNILLSPQRNKINLKNYINKETDKIISGTILFRRFTNLFNLFPIGAIILPDNIFCVHGGIPRNTPTMQEIESLFRFEEVPLEGEICDLLWSDPASKNHSLYQEKDSFFGIGHLPEGEWSENSRGAGIFYGPKLTKKFMKINRIEKIIRSHQLVMEGYKNDWDCVSTVWSAPNYCYRCGNKGAIVNIDKHKFEIIKFDDVKEQKNPNNDERLDFMREI